MRPRQGEEDSETETRRRSWQFEPQSAWRIAAREVAGEKINREEVTGYMGRPNRRVLRGLGLFQWIGYGR
jgi:hypothetical protein